MIRNPVTGFISVSTDAIRDALGEAPAVIMLAGVIIRTVLGGAGSGTRSFFACPACQRRVLLLFMPKHGGRPGCRHCYRLSYPSSFLRGSAIEPSYTAIQRSFA